MASISKPIYIGQTLFLHTICYFVSPTHPQISAPSLTTFFFLSLPPPPSLSFALLCFLCRWFVFVIFILNVSELAEAHIRDVQRTKKCVRRVCLRGHTQEYMHDVFRCIGPHSVHGCVLNWILYWPRCARDWEKKIIGALKTYFNTEYDLNEMWKWGNLNHSTLSGYFIHLSTWGESESLYCNFFK